MATILPLPGNKSKQRFHAVKIDMTPMVDLGFLLITFFIYTTALSHPTVMKLTMPKEGPPQDIYEKGLLTVLIDREKVFVYEGAFDEAIAEGTLIETTYHVQTGLGHYIRQKQKKLEASNEKNYLMVAIKPLPSSSYQDVMNVLDEMLINNVQRYGIINLSEEEKQFAVSKSQKPSQ